MKVSKVSIENFKRVAQVSLQMSETGLYIIGGNNRQGKSSILDSIAIALNGGKLPTNAIKDGADKSKIEITLSNGWKVTKSITPSGARLKVSDPAGLSGSQKILDDMLCKFALNIGSFLSLNDKEKVKLVTEASGIDLAPIEDRIARDFEERTLVNREVDRLKAICQSMRTYPETEPVDVSALLKQQQTGDAAIKECDRAITDYTANELHLILLRERITKLREEADTLEMDADVAEESLSNMLTPTELTETRTALLISTSKINDKIARSQQINEQAAANLASKTKREELVNKVDEAEALTTAINAARKEMLELCKEMPLNGLAVEDGALTYKGKAWDCMSHSEQLIVATSIVRKLNPECEFVLIDKLESMDLVTLEGFNTWLTENNLQAIATRVSNGPECSVIIADGKVEECI